MRPAPRSTARIAARTTRRARPATQRASLLTPVAKAFSTDIGTEVASLGVQVHGGMGFIEETGAAQHYRDARIAQIYEGTNGIQAIDLVTRKLPLEGGAVVRGYLDELRRTVAAVQATNDPAFGATGARLARCGRQPRPRDHMAARHARQVARCGARRRDALSAPVRLGGGRLRAGRGGACRRAALDGADGGGRVALARFFAENIAVQAGGLETTVTEGADSVSNIALPGAALEGRPMTDQVIVTDEGPVRTIRMNRPEKKNALTSAMYDAMAEAIETRERRFADPLRGDRRRARRLLGRQRSRRLHEGRDRRRGARQCGAALSLFARARRAAAGRRRAGRRGRHRHHDDAALRLRGGGERCALLDAVRRARAGAGGGIEPDRAAPDGTSPRVRAAGDGQAAVRRGGEGVRPDQPGRAGR